MKTKYYFSVLFFLFSFIFNAGTAQIPTYGLLATCFYCGNAGPNSFNFSIYIYSSDSTYFEYSGGEYSFEVDTSIANGGNLTYQIISSDLPIDLRPRNPSVTRNGQYFILNLERNDFPDPGNGYNLTRRAVYVAAMRVTTSAASIGSPVFIMNWRNSNHSVYATRIFAYVNMVNTEITTPNSHEMDFIFPVELSHFSSNVNRNIVTLNWTTASELNNSGFDIERLDVNGQPSNNWKKISFIKGKGTTNLSTHYIFTDGSLNAGKYKYRLKQIDYNGNFEYYNLSNEVLIAASMEFNLSQNYPNPFNPVTVIRYSLIENSFVTLKVYDVLGNEVATLVNARQNRGNYNYQLSIVNYQLPSGIYFYKLEAGSFIETKRMMLLK